MTATAEAQPAPPAPTPVPATLVERILLLAAELARAHDAKAYSVREYALAELPQLPVVEPRTFVTGTVGAAAYSIGAHERAVHVMLREAVGDHEAVVAFPPDVFAQFLGDGRALLAWLADGAVRR